MASEEESGPIKLKDGLYIGDSFSAKHLPSILETQTTHIINCCGREVANHFESYGIKYLTFDWQESDAQILADKAESVAARVLEFIDQAHQNHESVLVHSLRGRGRSCIALCLYFLKKYQWGLYKVLEFMDYRVPGLEMKQSLFNELLSYEARLKKQGLIKTNSWDLQVPDPTPEQTLLKHTYYNAKKIDLAGPFPQKIKTPSRVQFRHDRNKVLLYGQTEPIARPRPVPQVAPPRPILRSPGLSRPDTSGPKTKSQRVLSQKSTRRPVSKDQQKFGKSRSICDPRKQGPQSKQSLLVNKTGVSPLYNNLLKELPRQKRGKQNLDKSVRERSFLKEQTKKQVQRNGTQSSQDKSKLTRQILKRMLSDHLSQLKKSDTSFTQPLEDRRLLPKQPVKPLYDNNPNPNGTLPPRPSATLRNNFIKDEQPPMQPSRRDSDSSRKEKAASLRKDRQKEQSKKGTTRPRQKTPPSALSSSMLQKSLSGKLKS